MPDNPVPVPYDPPVQARPDPLIYEDALAARRNVVSLLLRRDRRRARREMVSYAALIALAAAAVYAIGNEKVYVYELQTDAAGRQRLIFHEDTYTLERGDMVEALTWWVFQTRSLSLDPVMNDKLHTAAKARLTEEARPGYARYLESVDPGPGWTRDVALNSFALTQVTAESEGPYASFLIEWTETDYYQLVEKANRRMLASVTIQIRPPSVIEMQAGNADGLWIAAFDIQPARGT